MITQGCEDAAEAIRRRAVQLVCDEGWPTAKAAQALGCAQRSVQVWCRKSRQGREPEQLRTKKAPGARPRLTAPQRERLVHLLDAGPEAAGFSPLWTRAKVTQLIQREFGVVYCEGHMSTLLRSLGLTPQMPRMRPSERNEEQILRWRMQRWPAIKKRRVVSAPR
jgi:transposase